MPRKDVLEQQAWGWADGIASTAEINEEHTAAVYLLDTACTNCKTNCRNSPGCVTGLGEKFWTSDAVDKAIAGELQVQPNLVRRSSQAPAGLVNLGATCYVNSLLQMWYHNPAFRSTVLAYEPEPLRQSSPADAANAAIFAQLQRVFAQLMYTPACFHSPRELIDGLQLSHSIQQDAQEFSKLFLNICEEALKASKAAPLLPALDELTGTFVYHTRCSTCGQGSKRPSRFYELELQIMKLKTLEDCIDSFFSAERLVGDNQYSCETCNQKRDALRFIKLDAPPDVLNLQLMRFRYDMKTYQKKKLADRISFPLVLDLSQFVAREPAPPDSADQAGAAKTSQSGKGKGKGKKKGGAKSKAAATPGKTKSSGRGKAGGRAAAAGTDTDDGAASANGDDLQPLEAGSDDATTPAAAAAAATDDAGDNPHIYELQAVLMHRGNSACHGHYIAHVRQASDNKWYELDDDLATPLNEEDLRLGTPLVDRKGKATGKKSARQSSNCVYMLSYRRCTTVERANAFLAECKVPEAVMAVVHADAREFEQRASAAETAMEQQRKELTGRRERMQTFAAELRPATDSTDFEWVTTTRLEAFLKTSQPDYRPPAVAAQSTEKAAEAGAAPADGSASGAPTPAKNGTAPQPMDESADCGSPNAAGKEQPSPDRRANGTTSPELIPQPSSPTAAAATTPAPAAHRPGDSADAPIAVEEDDDDQDGDGNAREVVEIADDDDGDNDEAERAEGTGNGKGSAAAGNTAISITNNNNNNDDDDDDDEVQIVGGSAASKKAAASKTSGSEDKSGKGSKPVDAMAAVFPLAGGKQGGKRQVRPICCPHGRLHPDAVMHVKRISSTAAAILHAVEPEIGASAETLSAPVITGYQAVCRPCIEERIEERLRTQQYHRDKEMLAAIIKGASDTDNTPTTGYLVCNTDLQRWMRLKERPAALKSVFNASLACDHDKRSLNMPKCTVVSKEAWKLITSNLPPKTKDGISPAYFELSSDEPACSTCLGEATNQQQAAQASSKQAAQEKAALAKLVSSKLENRPALLPAALLDPDSAPPTAGTLQLNAKMANASLAPHMYVLPTAFVAEWRRWMKSPSKRDRPASLGLETLFCEHGLLCVDVVAELTSGSEQAAVTAVWEDEWTQLAQFYPPKTSHATGVQIRTDEQNRGHATPATCAECMEKARVELEQRDLTYTNAEIWVHKVGENIVRGEASAADGSADAANPTTTTTAGGAGAASAPVEGNNAGESAEDAARGETAAAIAAAQASMGDGPLSQMTVSTTESSQPCSSQHDPTFEVPLSKRSRLEPPEDRSSAVLSVDKEDAPRSVPPAAAVAPAPMESFEELQQQHLPQSSPLQSPRPPPETDELGYKDDVKKDADFDPTLGDEQLARELESVLEDDFGMSTKRRSSRKRRNNDWKSTFVKCTELVHDVKLRIMPHFGAMPADQHLFLDGCELDNSKTLAACAIKPGSVLQLRVDVNPDKNMPNKRTQAKESGFAGTALLSGGGGLKAAKPEDAGKGKSARAESAVPDVIVIGDDSEEEEDDDDVVASGPSGHGAAATESPVGEIASAPTASGEGSIAAPPSSGASQDSAIKATSETEGTEALAASARGEPNLSRGDANRPRRVGKRKASDEGSGGGGQAAEKSTDGLDAASDDADAAAEAAPPPRHYPKRTRRGSEF